MEDLPMEYLLAIRREMIYPDHTQARLPNTDANLKTILTTKTSQT